MAKDETKTFECVKELIGLVDSDNYFEVAQAISLILPHSVRDQLRQLVHGPIWDGDVISKARRDMLLTLGLAVRVCLKGEQGYTGATYLAYSVVNNWPSASQGT